MELHQEIHGTDKSRRSAVLGRYLLPLTLRFLSSSAYCWRMRADTVCSAYKSMAYKLRLILAIEGLSEENKAVINTTVSFGVAELDSFDAVCELMLNFVCVLLPLKLKGPFLHMCWPMTIQQCLLNVSFCNASKHLCPIRYEGLRLCLRPKVLVTSAWEIRYLRLCTASPTIHIRIVPSKGAPEAY